MQHGIRYVAVVLPGEMLCSTVALGKNASEIDPLL
jgi:hypothetical protein